MIVCFAFVSSVIKLDLFKTTCFIILCHKQNNNSNNMLNVILLSAIILSVLAPCSIFFGA